MQTLFVSWSGGKDGCFACYRAITNGYNVRYLVNMVTGDGRMSRSHGQPSEILQIQSQAMGIPLIQRRTTRDTYETEFVNMLRAFKQKGIDGGVFGDIDFNEHRKWIERVCREAKITPHLPLWEQDQAKIMSDFIEAGFEAVVVAAKKELFSEEVLGRKVDLDFINDLAELGKAKNITPCGEAGEYHTFVINGPLFRKRIEILETRKVSREGHWIMEILNADLRIK